MEIPGPEKLNLIDGNEAANWNRFYSQWKCYEVATGLIEKTDEVRIATFLCFIGPEGHEKFNSFDFENEEDKTKMDKVIEKFEMDFQKRTNIIIERNRFLLRRQKENETIDQFVT